MRRFLVTFLLCLLPVQISWAVVADYCAHEQAGDTQHFAHHADEYGVSAAALDADQPDSGIDPVKLNVGHDHCHLVGFIGLLSEAPVAAPVVPTLSAFHGLRQVFSSQILDRPERPKWPPLA